MLLQFDFPKTYTDLLVETTQANYSSSTKSVPSMDVAEYESEYVAILELPGVRKEDVKITFEKGILTVEGVRKPYEMPEDAKVLLNEMRVRDFSRSLRIPVQIDSSGINAELESGILKVVMPKAQEARSRTIAIK